MSSMLIDVFVIAGFASWQVVETWHHGSLFAEWNKWLKSYKKSGKGTWWQKFFCNLLICPFCLAHWTSGVCVLVLLLTGPDSVLRWPVYVLAVTRLAQLLNDVTHRICRSPSSEADASSDIDDEDVDIVIDETLIDNAS